jgi:murein DD-endopeptidase MepM/ murein hydrolase activator NlpD
MVKLILIPFFLFSIDIIPDKGCYEPGEVFILRTKDKNLVVKDKSLTPIKRGKDFNLFLLAVDLFERKEKIIYLPETQKKLIFSICEKEFPVRRYYFPRELVDLSPEDLKRANREKEMFDRIWETVTEENFLEGFFLLPVTGVIKFNFGERRFMNDEERSPHTGVDIYADEGTPVMASERGRVVFAGNTFFGGNSIVIDHGLGIYTMYFHLKEMFVKEGEIVERGKIIGSVGKTGRATGPHLHWGVRVAGARVDPISLLEVSKALQGKP